MYYSIDEERASIKGAYRAAGCLPPRHHNPTHSRNKARSNGAR